MKKAAVVRILSTGHGSRGVSPALVADELDVGRATPSQRRDEHREAIAPTPNGREATFEAMGSVAFAGCK